MTPENYNRFAVGHTTGEIIRRTDDNYLMVSMVVTDPKAIEAIEQGRDELSIGSRASLMMHDGEHEGNTFSMSVNGTDQV